MEHNKELVSLLEKCKKNKRTYEKTFVNLSDVPPKYVAEAIYSFIIEELETIVDKKERKSFRVS